MLRLWLNLSRACPACCNDAYVQNSNFKLSITLSSFQIFPCIPNIVFYLLELRQEKKYSPILDRDQNLNHDPMHLITSFYGNDDDDGPNIPVDSSNDEEENASIDTVALYTNTSRWLLL